MILKVDIGFWQISFCFWNNTWARDEWRCPTADSIWMPLTRVRHVGTWTLRWSGIWWKGSNRYFVFVYLSCHFSQEIDNSPSTPTLDIYVRFILAFNLSTGWISFISNCVAHWLYWINLLFMWLDFVGRWTAHGADGWAVLRVVSWRTVDVRHPGHVTYTVTYAKREFFAHIVALTFIDRCSSTIFIYSSEM